MKIAIISDSGCGLDLKEAQKLGIYLIPLQIIEEEKSMRDCIDISTLELYEHLKQGIMPKTSMPLGEDVENTIDAIIKAGYSEIIAIPLSSGLSSTHQIISMIAQQKNIPLQMVEIASTCAIQRYLVECAIQLVNREKTSDEIISIFEKVIQTNYTYILPNDLQHLKRGGRLTPLAASMASLLKIKPILKIAPETDGKIDVAAKVRTESKAVQTAIEMMGAKLDDGVYKIFVIHSNCEDKAEAIANTFLKKYKNVEVSIDFISSVIASHTGLDCIAIQMIKKI